MPNHDPADRDALARLADSVRRLIDVTVSIDAASELLAGAAARIDCLVAELRPSVPTPPPPRYPGGGATPGEFFPYDCVMGKWNPLALPIRIEWDAPRAVGSATFGTPYEGPPGCVHGAAIAAAFDQVFNVANLMMGTPGPTRRLELRYRRPTPLRRELRFEAWRERVEDRKVFAAGRLLAGDEVTVE